ncbi:hypothetical protein [Paeniglutamicibacter quisquiliarum]|nr:hypothetical protein [Paeniglutamicibacter quisquiliarum]
MPTYFHGVAIKSETTLPDDPDTIERAAGAWAVFSSLRPFTNAQ